MNPRWLTILEGLKKEAREARPEKAGHGNETIHKGRGISHALE